MSLLSPMWDWMWPDKWQKWFFFFDKIRGNHSYSWILLDPPLWPTITNFVRKIHPSDAHHKAVRTPKTKRVVIQRKKKMWSNVFKSFPQFSQSLLFGHSETTKNYIGFTVLFYLNSFFIDYDFTHPHETPHKTGK